MYRSIASTIMKTIRFVKPYDENWFNDIMIIYRVTVKCNRIRIKQIEYDNLKIRSHV